MRLLDVLVPVLLLLFGLSLIIYSGRLYDTFLNVYRDHNRTLWGDDKEPSNFLVFPKGISVLVGRLVGLFIILFSMSMIWVFFISGW